MPTLPSLVRMMTTPQMEITSWLPHWAPTTIGQMLQPTFQPQKIGSARQTIQLRNKYLLTQKTWITERLMPNIQKLEQETNEYSLHKSAKANSALSK